MSLSLLLYVAWGEMVRTNQRFQTERLQSQAQPLLAALQAHVQSGLAAEQFAGFAALSVDMLEVDPQLRAVGMETPSGRWLFDTQPVQGDVETLRIPVRNRFETVGWLSLTVDADAVRKPVRTHAAWLACSALLLGLLAFWRLVRAAGMPQPLPAQRRILLWLLVAQTCVVSAVMWQVYSAGARSVAQSQANALVSRLTEVYQHGLVFDDFSDIADVLAQERARSRHVQQLSVRMNDALVFRSRDDATGIAPVALTELSATREVQADEPVKLTVTLSVPVSVIGFAIARNLKNFAFLFVATVFAAMLLLRLLHGYASVAQVSGPKKMRAQNTHTPELSVNIGRETGAHLAETETLKVSALLFMSVFCDQLSAAFLPPWIADVAQRSAFSSGSGAWAFTAYFVAFAVALLPAQRAAARGHSRGLLTGGAWLVCAGALTLWLMPHFVAVVLARACSGIGQGMVFVAAQALLLAWSRQAGSLGANTSIVFQFNAGMICGLALGSLLVVYVAPEGVFCMIAILAAMVAMLAVGLEVQPASHVPIQADNASAAVTAASPSAALGTSAPSSLRYWRDAGFSMPALLIGIPSKAVMTGVLVYGLPLLLSLADVGREEAGQLLLFYAVGVLLCNHWIGRLQPVLPRLRSLAGLAMCVSGAAIALLAPAFSGSPGETDLLAIGLILLSVLLLGMAHGAINAPVVTLVSGSDVAHRYGSNTVATYYRLVERAGHVAGPALFSHLLLASGDTALALKGLGFVIAAMGLVALLWGYRVSAAVRRAAVSACWLAVCTGAALVLSLTRVSDARAQGVANTQNNAQKNAQTTPWISLSPALADAWVFTSRSDDTGDFLVATPRAGDTPANPSPNPPPNPTSSRMSVTLLMFKPSSAYDTALSRMLQVWSEKGLRVNVQIAHVRNDPALAHAAVSSAMRDRAALMIGVGSDSAAFLHDHYRKGRMALLSVCAKDPVLMQQVSSYETGSGTSMAYTSLNSPVDVQLNHLLQVRPGLRELAIIVDRRNSSAWQTQTLPLEKRAKDSGITVHKVIVDGQDDVAAQLMQNMGAALSAMRRNDANGAVSAFWITGSSAVFPHVRLINQTAGSVPVFSAVPDLVKAGNDSADVSIGVSFEENAYLAALYAQRIVSGEVSPGALPVGIVSPPEIAINFMKTRQSGLRLPFSFFEKAGTVFNARGELIRWRGSRVKPDATGGS